MPKIIYGLTHGSRKPGADPPMTDFGRSTVDELRRLLPAEPFARVVIGSGQRHIQSLRALNLGENQPTWEVCPLLGGPECETPNSGTNPVLVLACGTIIDPLQYLGLDELVNAEAIDPWRIVGYLAQTTRGQGPLLLVTGTEFVGCLLSKGVTGVSGRLYVLDCEERSVTLLR